ncbi:hypothetical protein [Yinghuangia seranimata]|uniref:hypothetical protein n=1 Tax=Yinghuangia seranimata TaxID=408067 RepID=UPI00248B4E89|nr:hypothetical protein [Yinghuangia seranimata]MDI2126948.1 hypothetical protein [Yinghuangia seranimata]
MRIRRWFIYREHGALHIERGADPKCRHCNGDGGWFVGGILPDEPEFAACPCSDGPSLRIRYRPLRRRTTGPVGDPWLSHQSRF